MSQPLHTLLIGEPSASLPDRAHLLLIALHLAETVEAVHASGGVLGTLDDHRLLVEPDGSVRLSDNTQTPAPAYLAPELQGSLTGPAQPAPQHDLFALAVLIFQLLMAGNHPYAGQWVGGGNLPEIPKAIQLGLYAYGASSVTPPPGSPGLNTLEPDLAELFKRSFAATSAIFRNRPTGAEWVRALSAVQESGRTSEAPAEPSSAPSAPTAQPFMGASASPEVRAPTSSPGQSLDLDATAHATPPATDLTAAQPGVEEAQSVQISISTPQAAPEPKAAFQGRRETKAPPTSRDSSHDDQEHDGPVPAADAAVESQPEAEMPAARGKGTFSRRDILQRALPENDPESDAIPSDEPEPSPSSSSVWGDIVEEFRWLSSPDATQPTAPDQSRYSTGSDQVGERRHIAQSSHSRPSTSRELVFELLSIITSNGYIIGLAAVFFLFLMLIAFTGRNDEWANPRPRPAVVRATRVPVTRTPRPAVTQTPRPRPTSTRIALVNNPTRASFRSNFDAPDTALPVTGERFSATIRNASLRLEVFGKGAHGKTMFSAAPATGDFTFTAQVGSTTGQGDVLIYVRKPDSGRTWAFAVDPVANTWGVCEEPPWSDGPIPLIPHAEVRPITREPLHTVTVTREGTRTSLLINGTAVSPQIAGSMPRIGGPVQVGLGAMIPEDPGDYDGQSFVVTIDRVAMVADEE